jgi:cellulose synthase/poly-beta-1,6-N-acetylglucosamine synthase-like glycosyltransferase
MDNNSAVLTVIIPITKIENKIDFVKFNLDIAKRCNFKVILVHDIQDSKSSKILNKLVEECEHWTLIEGKFGNAAKARNEALKIAETEWITFWDSDDKVRGNNFLYLLNQTIKENSDVGIGNFDITDFNKNNENLL